MSSLKKVKNNLIKNIHFFLIVIFALFPLLASSTSLKSKFVIVFTFSFIIFLGILNSKTSLQRIEELVLFFIFTIFVFFNFYDFWRTRNFLLYILAYVLFAQLVNRVNIESTNKFMSKLFFISLLLNLSSFNKPLVFKTSFRQHQNAISARFMADNSISIFNPLPHIGLETLNPYEFPILQIFSSILQKIGFEETYTLRPVSWMIFLIFLFVFYKFLNENFNQNVSNSIILLVFFHPLIFYNSNSYMIEFIPHIFGLASLIFYKKNQNLSYIFLSISIVSKITTGFIYLIIFTISFLIKKSKFKVKNLINLKIIFFVIVPNTIWLLISDYIKSKNEFTLSYTSKELRGWNFGSIEQRANLDSYIRILNDINLNFFGLDSLNILAVVFLIFLLIKGNIYSITLLTPFIFLNLYLVHEYYYIAIIPFLGLVFVTRIYQIKSIDEIKIYQIITFLIIFLSVSFYNTDGKFEHDLNKYVSNKKMSNLELVLNQNYQNSDYIFTNSKVLDWNPSLFYLTDKKGLMWTNNSEKFVTSIDYLENNKIEVMIFEQGFEDMNQINQFLRYRNKEFGTTKFKLEVVTEFSGSENINFVIISDYKETEKYDKVYDFVTKKFSDNLNLNLSENQFDFLNTFIQNWEIDF